MNIVLEIVIAILASFGAVSAVICIFGDKTEKETFFHNCGEMITIVRDGADVEKLKSSINTVLWMRSHGADNTTVIIIDDDLTGESRRYAENLCALDEKTFMCSTAELFNL